MPRAPKKQPSNEEDVKPYDKTAAPASPAKKGWTKEEKEIILFTILDSAQIDWNEMATKLNGRTATQAKDQWRQTLLPSIKKNTGLFVGKQ